MELVRETFREQKLVSAAEGFERSWRTALHDGYVEGSFALEASPAAASPSRRPRGPRADWEVAFRPGTFTTAASPPTAGCRSCPNP